MKTLLKPFKKNWPGCPEAAPTVRDVINEYSKAPLKQMEIDNQPRQASPENHQREEAICLGEFSNLPQY
jgi:hypothetical protein